MDAPTVSVDLGNLQGLVRSGYKHLFHSSFLLFRIGGRSRTRDWLRRLEVTSADGAPETTAINVAFSLAGLEAWGVGEDVLAGFSNEFREGMVTPHRSRILGDAGESAPETWSWGRDPAGVHGIVLLYAATMELLQELRAKVLGGDPVDIVTELPGGRLPKEREHFGFRDGIAQPRILGLTADAPGANVIAPGELLLGYPNQYGNVDTSPALRAPHPELPHADFGRDGTYLVLRQLEQRVAAFWEFVRRASVSSGFSQRFPNAEDAAVMLAAKMVGRWPNGAPLTLSPDREEPSSAGRDDFDYAHSDPHGLKCPFGSHLRRSNPRNWFTGDTPEAAAEVSNHHRIVRRGRSYGKPLAPSMLAADLATQPDDREQRGLNFVCLNANIARQFEFVQHTWMNSPKFGGLHSDPDPFVGDTRGAHFTVQARPVRVRVGSLPSFVRVVGGAYFFLPSMAALRYLGSPE